MPSRRPTFIYRRRFDLAGARHIMTTTPRPKVFKKFTNSAETSWLGAQDAGGGGGGKLTSEQRGDHLARRPGHGGSLLLRPAQRPLGSAHRPRGGEDNENGGSPGRSGSVSLLRPAPAR